jgi:hypothetical protein
VIFTMLSSVGKKPVWPVIGIAVAFCLWVLLVAAGVIAGVVTSKNTPGVDLDIIVPLVSILVGVGLYVSIPLLIFTAILFRRLSLLGRLLGIVPAGFTLLLYLFVFLLR